MARSQTSRKRNASPLPTLKHRTAGILLHPTSLPGPHGSGDIGGEARRFVEFVADAGHSWWQMLPIGPIGAGNSPYSSEAAFAGGRHLINLELLVEDGLLERADVKRISSKNKDRVDFTSALRYRRERLHKAFERFRARRGRRGDYERFCEASRAWLDDYALFRALKDACKNASWTQWPRELVQRKAGALRAARRELAQEVEYEQFLQYIFDRQWTGFRTYCNSLGVAIIGDLPIFVCHDSVDVWANQDLYLLDKRGNPTVVSGVPPDYFSKTGQLWGHPLYRWERHARTGYRWWTSRFASILGRFDAVRIDHFLGFNRLWNVSAKAKTAMRGKWTKTPGDAIFKAVKKTLGALPIIAEDLGLLVPEAAALRDRWDLPGMRVIQFAFEGDAKARYDQPHRYPFYCVAYTGTHDNNTSVGWFNSLPRRGGRGEDGLNIRERTLEYAGGEGDDIHRDLIRLVYRSAANVAVIPMQDALGLDGAARMNFPSTTTGNWEWRMRPGAASKTLARELKKWTTAYERAGTSAPRPDVLF